MTIIEIRADGSGAHNENTVLGYTTADFPLLEGWAVLPEEVGTPNTLENYPFGEIAVEEIDGVPTVTGWTPLPIPEPEKPEMSLDPTPSLEERVDTLETETAALTAAIERGLSL